jgi:hypothetical protein
MGRTLLLSPYCCLHGFQDGFLEVSTVDVILSVEFSSLKLTVLTPPCDGGSDDGIPPLCLEDTDDIVGLEYLLFGYHWVPFYQVCLLSVGMSFPSEFGSASTHSYSMPSMTL